MFKYLTISTNDGDYTISCNYNEKGEVYMPSLNFYIDGDLEDIWGNETYLITSVLPYLRGEKEDKELEHIFSEVKEEVLEIFEEAIRIKMFTDE